MGRVIKIKQHLSYPPVDMKMQVMPTKTEIAFIFGQLESRLSVNSGSHVAIFYIKSHISDHNFKINGPPPPCTLNFIKDESRLKPVNNDNNDTSIL